MKYLYLILLSLTFFYTSAQTSYNTGSIELDTDLSSINLSANLNFTVFKSDLCSIYHVDKAKVDYMKSSLKMDSGEIYLSLEIARITNRPIDEVLICYKKHKKKGWGHIAKEMGIKPGSKEFHDLKLNTKNKKAKTHKKYKKGHHNKHKSKKK